MSITPLRLAALSFAGLAALSLAACGGATADPDANLQVSDADTTSAALASPDPAAAGATDGEAGDREDDDGDHQDGDHQDNDGDHQDNDGAKGDHHKGGKDHCNDREHDQHKHHRHHKFKVLDRIDGRKDHVITIASLPAALPDRLIARLHAIDTDGNGLVTKDEVKAWRHTHGE